MRRCITASVATFALGLLLAARVVAFENLGQAPQERLDGVWHAVSLTVLRPDEGGSPPLLPLGADRYARNRAELVSEPDRADSYRRCLPPGVPRLMTHSGNFQVVVGSSLVSMLFEDQHQFRLIYVDMPHFEAVGPAWLGQSIGHWQGDELVIDSNGFNDRTFLDDSGLPHSDQLHVIEHLRLDRSGRLTDRMTIEDPVIFSRAWQTTVRFARSRQTILREDYCLKRRGLLGGSAQ